MRFARCVVLLAGLAGLCMTALPAMAQLRLVTEEEARLPDANVPTTRAITRGPGVKLTSSSDVSAKSFPLEIQLLARGGAKPDPATVKVEYLKTPVVDVTDRLRAQLKPESISVSSVQLPTGHHRFRVSVKDTEGRAGSALIELHAK